MQEIPRQMMNLADETSSREIRQRIKNYPIKVSRLAQRREKKATVEPMTNRRLKQSKVSLSCAFC